MLDEFLKRYGMRIVKSHKQSEYLPSISMKHYSMIDRDGNSMDPKWFRTEKLFTIEIAESDLDRLEEHLCYFRQVPNPSEHYEMREKEAYYRKNNPAVKKAWENYKMLLKLTAEGKTFD